MGAKAEIEQYAIPQPRSGRLRQITLELLGEAHSDFFHLSILEAALTVTRMYSLKAMIQDVVAVKLA